MSLYPGGNEYWRRTGNKKAPYMGAKES